MKIDRPELTEASPAKFAAKRYIELEGSGRGTNWIREGERTTNQKQASAL